MRKSPKPYQFARPCHPSSSAFNGISRYEMEPIDTMLPIEALE